MRQRGQTFMKDETVYSKVRRMPPVGKAHNNRNTVTKTNGN